MSQWLVARRFVPRMVQLAMPIRADAAALNFAIVDHPASRARSVCVVNIAKRVLANFFTIAPCPQLRAERLPVPPRKNSFDKVENAHGYGSNLISPLMPDIGRQVQRAINPTTAHCALTRQRGDLDFNAVFAVNQPTFYHRCNRRVLTKRGPKNGPAWFKVRSVGQHVGDADRTALAKLDPASASASEMISSAKRHCCVTSSGTSPVARSTPTQPETYTNPPATTARQ